MDVQLNLTKEDGEDVVRIHYTKSSERGIDSTDTTAFTWVIKGFIFIRVPNEEECYVYARHDGTLVNIIFNAWPFWHAKVRLPVQALNGTPLPSPLLTQIVENASKHPHYFGDAPVVILVPQDLSDYLGYSELDEILPLTVFEGDLKTVISSIYKRGLNARVILVTRESGDLGKGPLYIVGDSGVGKSVFAVSRCLDEDSICEIDCKADTLDGNARGGATTVPPKGACVIKLTLYVDTEDGGEEDVNSTSKFERVLKTFEYEFIAWYHSSRTDLFATEQSTEPLQVTSEWVIIVVRDSHGTMVQHTFECGEELARSGCTLTGSSEHTETQLRDDIPADYNLLDSSRYRASIEFGDQEKAEYAVYICDTTTQTTARFLYSKSHGGMKVDTSVLKHE